MGEQSQLRRLPAPEAPDRPGPRASRGVRAPRVVERTLFAPLGILSLGLVALELWADLAHSRFALWTTYGIDLLLVALVGADVARAARRATNLQVFFRERWPDVLVGVPVLVCLAAGTPRAAGAVVLVRQAILAGMLLVRSAPARRLLAKVDVSPLQLLTVSFAATILAGTLFLMAPAATTDGRGAPFLTALFTSASATCVTGLIVVDTGSYFTRFGQAVILLLIQVGALGIMTLTSAFVLLFRGKLGLRERGVMQEVLEAADAEEFRYVVRTVCGVTIVLELIGTVALLPSMLELGPERGVATFGDALWLSLFHSVSAFCNAGFALWSDSIVGFTGNYPLTLVIAVLIVLGGLGFGVVLLLLRPVSWRHGVRGFWRRLDVHAKVVLPTTLGLIFVGWIGYFFFEFDATLVGLSTSDKLVAALFQSITARTAGFNSVDTSAMKPVTTLLMMVFMFIGGAPGGVSGGVKVTTVVVLALAIRAMVQRRGELEIFGRSLANTATYRAIAVVFISFVVVLLTFGGLLITEPGMRFERLLFEAVSAFNLVGLSMGVTGDLSSAGRLVVIGAMFVGRIGPFVFALAVGERGSHARYSYPRGKVLIG